MIIKEDSCTGCGSCIPTCPVGAIVMEKNSECCTINQDLCVECETCLRSQMCPLSALQQVKLVWPRLVRSLFSNPLTIHKQTLVPGRGTEGMKTNEVTGRYGPGIVGVSIELGRPGISTGFDDINKVTEVCARHGAHFEPLNPLTQLMVNPSLGAINPEVIGERVLSVLIEFEMEQKKLVPFLKELRAFSEKIRTVFSIGLTQLVDPGGELPVLEILSSQKFPSYPNGKINLGLGRPRYNFQNKNKLG